jgi:hypothetical protein
MKLSGVLVLAIGLFVPIARAQAQPAQALPRVAIEDTGAAIDIGSPPVPVVIRIVAEAIDRTLDERIAGYANRTIPLWISVKGPLTVGAAEPWRVALHDLLARHAARIAILEIAPGPEPKLATFAMRLAATEARSARDDIRIALALAPESTGAALARLYTGDLAPYVDVLTPPMVPIDRAAVLAHLSKVDPDARIAMVGNELSASVDQAARQLLETHLEAFGTEVVIASMKGSTAVREALARLTPLKTLLSGDIAALDAAAAGLALSLDGRDVSSSLRHRLLFDDATFATFLVYWGDTAQGTLDVGLTLPVEGQPVVYRLTDGSKLGASDYSRAAETSRVRLKVPIVAGPVLVDFNEGATAVYAQRTDVSAARMLSVQEVIARHQQQQRAQDLLVRNYSASARIQQHFRPTMTDPGYDVVTDNRYYVAADGIEWEELTFSVNGSKWGADRPPFPMLQPEKVLSLPLQLRFDNDYSYRLEGTERVGDYDCYVVRFEPTANSSSLYRGTVWIDRKTFARVRVQAVQTGLSAPVVSNEEIQIFSPIATIGKRPIFLFSALDARQIIMIAGRNILLEKKVAFSGFRVNDSSFDEARMTARRGSGIMYRETDRGLRYYIKQGDTRVVSDRATTAARAMAMGVTIDPSYGFPLPIFGINYLNFQFRGRQDTQLAILFAGVLAAGNIQRPKLGGTPFDASVDFFAIAAPSSDRVYEASGEREAERLLTWPLTTGLNLGWQYTAFQKVSAQYQFRFDGYVRDRTTVEAFRPPASTVTNGLGGAWEYRRGGYSAVFNGAWYTRAGWRDWGFAPDPTSKPTYVKYSAALSRDFYLGPFQKIHLNGAWFGGRDLDRFGKYQFGMFDDTRIHGVPASGVRFEELGMARGSYSFNIFDQYRFDLFLEQAWGRDQALDRTWQPITGIGAALNVRSFWGTILRVDGGKSFLPDRYRGVGSATLQVMFLKPLASR